MTKRIFPDLVRRGMTALIIAGFYWRLPNIMSIELKGVVIVMIVLFFFGFPNLKGVPGGVVAGGFSLAFAGLGHLYVREYARAFLFLFGGIFAYMTSGYSSKSVIFNILLFIISAFDAFSFGKRGFGII